LREKDARSNNGRPGEIFMKKLILAVALTFAVAAGAAVMLTVLPQTALAGPCGNPSYVTDERTSNCVTTEPAAPMERVLLQNRATSVIPETLECRQIARISTSDSLRFDRESV
jgi:hypothetical protein